MGVINFNPIDLDKRGPERMLLKTYPAALLRAQAHKEGAAQPVSKAVRARIRQARARMARVAAGDQETAIQLLAAVPEVALWLQNFPGWLGYAWESDTPAVWSVYFLASEEGEWLGEGTVNIATGEILSYFVPRELTPEEYTEQLALVEYFRQNDAAVVDRIGDAGDFWQHYTYYSRWETLWYTYYYYGLDAFAVVLKYNKSDGTVVLQEIYDPNQLNAEKQVQQARDTAVELAWTAPGISLALEPYDSHQSTVVPQATAGQYRVEFYADDVLRFWALTDVNAYRLLASQPSAGAVAPTVASGLNGNDIVLTWATHAANDGYEVHRSTTPFFTPTPASLLTTLAADRTSYTDVGAASSTQLRYFYIVQAKAASRVAPSNQIGAMRYSLNNSGNQYTLLGIPFAVSGLTTAAALATYLGEVATLLKWSPTTQSFRFFIPPATGDNFTIAAGDAIFVQTKAGAQSSVVFTGSVATVAYTLMANSYNFLTLPPQRSALTTASQVAANLGHTRALLSWQADTQTFRIFVPPNTGDNFTLGVGQPLIVLLDSTAPATWPTTAGALDEPAPIMPLAAVDQELAATFTALLHPENAAAHSLTQLFMPLIYKP